MSAPTAAGTVSGGDGSGAPWKQRAPCLRARSCGFPEHHDDPPPRRLLAPAVRDDRRSVLSDTGDPLLPPSTLREHGMEAISPTNTTFILLAFEGPDRYSLAGGLGMRVTELSLALASAGYRTHVLFVGDPHAPATETRCGGRLVLHRWCQWISQYYPGGVYDGEEGKLVDFTESAPEFVAHDLARPAGERGDLVVVLGEEWQMAEAMCRVSDLLHEHGQRSRGVLFWNANNTMGFHRINWGRLAFTTTITTVSRYMKHLMWGYGVNPLVIPNGIPERLLRPVPDAAGDWLRQSLTKPV